MSGVDGERAQELVVSDIQWERIRQDKKWGPDRVLHYSEWSDILSEEVGEWCQARLGRASWGDIYDEIIQVAAVAVAIAEQMQREPEAGFYD